MTNHSPLIDTLDKTGQPATVSDMVNTGYNDFAQGEGARMHIVSALYALDNQISDYPAKSHIINELVAALSEMDKEQSVKTEISLDKQMRISLSVEPNGNTNR